jgi:hypothetical protein
MDALCFKILALNAAELYSVLPSGMKLVKLQQ